MSNTASSTTQQPKPRFVLGADRLSVVDMTLKSIVDKTTSLLMCRTSNSADAEFIVEKLNSHEQLVAALNKIASGANFEAALVAQKALDAAGLRPVAMALAADRDGARDGAASARLVPAAALG